MSNNEFKIMLENLYKKSEEELKNIAIEINNIIKYRIKDRKTIEAMLDNLLSFSTIAYDKVKHLYYELLIYYSEIDFEAAIDYKNYYLEMACEEGYTKKR